MTEEELYVHSKEIQAPFHLLKETARLKRLPVVSFAAGGVATPGKNCSCSHAPLMIAIANHSPLCLADAALMMQLGCDGGALNCVVLRTCGLPLTRVQSLLVQESSRYVSPRSIQKRNTNLDALPVVWRCSEARSCYCTGCYALQQPQNLG